MENCNHLHYLKITCDLSDLECQYLFYLNDIAIINFHDFSKPTVLRDINIFTNTSALTVSLSSLSQVNENIITLSNLRYLKITGRETELLTNEITQIPGLQTIERLELYSLQHLVFIDTANMPNLTGIVIDRCFEFHDLSCLRSVPTVYLEYLPGVTDISTLTSVINLSLIRLINVSVGWESLQEQCESLTIQHNRCLSSFASCNFKKLKYLFLQDCEQFNDLTNVNNVNELILSGCQNLTDLSLLKPGVGKINKLTIENCQRIKSFNSLNGIPFLKISSMKDEDLVTIGNNRVSLGNHSQGIVFNQMDFYKIPFIKNSPVLEISNCANLQFLSSNSLNHVLKLTLMNCNKITSFIKLPNLISLTITDLHLNLTTSTIDCESYFINLQYLKIINCNVSTVLLPTSRVLRWLEIRLKSLSCLQLRNLSPQQQRYMLVAAIQEGRSVLPGLPSMESFKDMY